ncbi:hypothetical protein Dvina_51475 [Dactylosporangium vinaceum]|uniref:Secreted protein/lipoprotein n=1 Tax=Dactylosporangium vinaceum TaxID=53362 RepID=A0ABV5M2S0_9ACTN|nr:hypothetical protein [Dactylosporangium vinaceum]UAB96268.1 hypothetical protein Dvina_51475 [Dactylosporangium vinaceum]
MTAPSTTAPAATDPASIGRTALDTYRGMWRAYQTALAVPDPASSELAKYATGDALKNLTSGLQSVKDQGLKGEGQIVTSPRVVGAAPANQPTSVDLEDCLDDSGSKLLRASPGPAFSDKPGGRRLTKATVQRQPDGTWKVTSFGAREVGTC